MFKHQMMKLKVLIYWKSLCCIEPVCLQLRNYLNVWYKYLRKNKTSKCQTKAHSPPQFEKK